MLIGTYNAILSSKHRSAIPAAFRTFLGKKMIIAKWYEDCLVITSSSNWENILDKIKGKDAMITSSIRDTDRFLLASAYELNTDDQGRVVFPHLLVEYAKLSNNIVFLGLGDRIEVWDQDKWIAKDREISKNSSEIMEKLTEIKKYNA